MESGQDKQSVILVLPKIAPTIEQDYSVGFRALLSRDIVKYSDYKQ